jgi:hypothetical protein
MADHQGDSSKTAPGAAKKPANEKAAAAAAQAQPAEGNEHYTIPRRTPERLPSQEQPDDARASRSRDEKPTDKQAAGQQQRSGAHPPQRLAAALAQAAGPVQGSVDEAQQSMNITHAMQQQYLAATNPSLLNHQQHFHPPPASLQQQYHSQSMLHAPFSQMPAAYQPAATGTPFGFGGYPLTSGFPSQPTGPCTSTSVPTAPLSWRGGGGDDQIEQNTAVANEMWKQLDDHPHLMDPATKPTHMEGHPCITGAAMFKSTKLNPGLIYLGEKNAGRWCEAREAVTLQIANSTSKFEYTLEDVRNSVASDIERLKGYDGACIVEGLPSSMGRHGPYRITMAAAAAHSLIEAEGVTLFHFDSTNGIDNETDFDVEILLPSGRKYSLARPDHKTRPPKKHDTSCRIRFRMGIPSGLSARNDEERDMAMSRLRDHLRQHFESFDGHNVGFHKHRNEHSGRFVQGLTGFVNHPTDVRRGDFIVKAFNELKYVNAGMGELVKLTLDYDDTVKAKIQKCCFQAACPKMSGGKCEVWIQTMRRHGLMTSQQSSDRARGKRKMDPTEQQIEFRAQELSAIRAKRPPPQCRAHTRGRCVNGSACTSPHTMDPATILCNSMVSAADKGVSATNKSYGYCALRLKNLPCPYKDCIHTLTIASPESEQKAEDEGEPAAVRMEE